MKKYTYLALTWVASLSLVAQSTSALKWRSIGPAVTSGRVADLAVDPSNPDRWVVATAAGGVWLTENHGLSFEPVFDGEGSYSIGCVTIDGSNPNTVWVGSGENNNQRSVAYGDGIYRSQDGGRSWTNMGLKNSEHIGMIAVHPSNSNIVWVAAYGPVWSPGGDRGIYKTTDGGQNWRRVLNVSENTGFNEVHVDPRNPKVLYATAHQRRRHVWTYISGGPESGLYKSEDGGETWNELKSGLPNGDKGRFALAISPVNPDVIYCMVEGHGLYRSSDRGASFKKQSDHATSGNYYVELFASPHDVDVVYSMDTYAQWSEDGGKTFKGLGERGKHVDNHVAWIDPTNPKHLVLGCDGGLYETWDHASSWHFKSNLPVTQFYRVAVDNATPFYNVYGGTQDNFSLGGPSRTINDRGIVNSDWYVTQTGDGFESQVDPINPNIVYAQAQYGWLQRYDRQSGEGVPIKPIEGPGEKAYRWNWDAPLLISPHNNKTLYFAANKLFKSSDRGNNWTAISGDLTRQIDRNALPVMGKVWSMDAIAKNQSTTIYGNIVALHESPVAKGLLYVGTDDGLVQISENDGGAWRKVDKFPGVPANTYVNDLKASLHDANVVYAAFNNHKNGDFKPYVLVSKNKGKTWESITGDLPERGSVYSIAQDHKDPNLLFAGTEFGIYYSTTGGGTWKKLGSGLPTVAVRDIDVQRRENDLVIATFGRGFYVLDDYSPLREFSAKVTDKDAHIFDVKPGLLYHEASPIGYGPPGFMGAEYFMASNPEVGVALTYHIKEAPKTLKAKRQAEEKKNPDAITYPTAAAMRAEDNEVDPYLLVVIRDAGGQPIRRIVRSYSSGITRFTWDGKVARQDAPRRGAYLVAPGTYSAQLVGFAQGSFDTLTSVKTFEVKHLNNLTLPSTDGTLLAFQERVNAASRRYDRFEMTYRETVSLAKDLYEALKYTPSANPADVQSVLSVQTALEAMNIVLNGDASLSKREFEALPGLGDRLSTATWGSYGMRSEVTGTMRAQLDYVEAALPALEKELLALQSKLKALETQSIKDGAPYVRGGLEKPLP